MDEILKIIFKCNKERKLLNPDDVKKICWIILKRNNYSFVNKIDFLSHDPNGENCAGLYYDDHLFFFYKGIIKMIEEHGDQLNDLYSLDGARVDIYNYYYLTIIFHELAHVRQHYIANSSHSSLEKQIFKLSFDLSSNREFYEENYCDILTEVNAENVAKITTIYLYSRLPKNFVTKYDLDAYQLDTLGSILHHNYENVAKKDIIISPSERLVDSFTESILEQVHINYDKYIKLINNNNLTLYKKMMLGLPISYQEFAYAESLYSRLKSDDSFNVIKKLQKKFN